MVVKSAGKQGLLSENRRLDKNNKSHPGPTEPQRDFVILNGKTDLQKVAERPETRGAEDNSGRTKVYLSKWFRGIFRAREASAQLRYTHWSRCVTI